MGIGLSEASDSDMEDIWETVVNDNTLISSLSCQDSYLLSHALSSRVPPRELGSFQIKSNHSDSIDHYREKILQ